VFLAGPVEGLIRIRRWYLILGWYLTWGPSGLRVVSPQRVTVDPDDNVVVAGTTDFPSYSATRRWERRFLPRC
jgi:hypothetical protein